MKSRKELIQDLSQSVEHASFVLTHIQMVNSDKPVLEALRDLQEAISGTGFIGANAHLSLANRISSFVRPACSYLQAQSRFRLAAQIYNGLAEVHFTAAKACRFRSPSGDVRILASPGNFWELRSFHLLERSSGDMPYIRIRQSSVVHPAGYHPLKLRAELPLERAGKDLGQLYQGLIRRFDSFLHESYKLSSPAVLGIGLLSDQSHIQSEVLLPSVSGKHIFSRVRFPYSSALQERSRGVVASKISSILTFRVTESLATVYQPSMERPEIQSQKQLQIHHTEHLSCLTMQN